MCPYMYVWNCMYISTEIDMHIYDIKKYVYSHMYTRGAHLYNLNQLGSTHMWPCKLGQACTSLPGQRVVEPTCTIFVQKIVDPASLYKLAVSTVCWTNESIWFKNIFDTASLYELARSNLKTMFAPNWFKKPLARQACISLPGQTFVLSKLV